MCFLRIVPANYAVDALKKYGDDATEGFKNGKTPEEIKGVTCSVPSQQVMHDSVTEWAKMQESLANSNRQLDKFNTATVVYD